jgi:uncharacterized protein YjdB
MKTRLVIALLAAALTIATCENEVTEAYLEVNDITISASSVTLAGGQSAPLVVTLTPSNAANTTLDWTADDPSVVQVTPGQDGTATIKGLIAGVTRVNAAVRGSGRTVSANVRVLAGVSPTGVEINKTVVGLKIDKTRALTAALSPAGTTYRDVRWESSDPSIVAVESNGLTATLRGIRLGGPVTVTVTTEDGGYTAEAEVSVSDLIAVETIDLAGAMTLYRNSENDLTAIIEPAASNEELEWSSSDPAIVAIGSSDGSTATLAAGRNAGMATITVTSLDTNKSAACTVSVKDKYRLVARTLKDGDLNANTTPNGPVLEWDVGDTWTASPGSPLKLVNADAGNINSRWDNITLVYLEDPLPTNKTYTFTAKVSLTGTSTSGNYGFAQTIINDAPNHPLLGSIGNIAQLVGIRSLGSGAFRWISWTNNPTPTVRAVTPTPDPSPVARDTVYTYTIKWDAAASARNYTLTFNNGTTDYTITWATSGGNNDVNTALLTGAAYYPGFIVASHEISVSEITIAVER